MIGNVELTWQRDNGEGCTEEEDGVADIVEVQVLYGPRAEEDEHHHKDDTVGAVVEVMEGGRLDGHKAGGGQGGRQNHKESHSGRDAGVLEPEDVAPEQALQLLVLKPAGGNHEHACNKRKGHFARDCKPWP